MTDKPEVIDMTGEEQTDLTELVQALTVNGADVIKANDRKHALSVAMDVFAVGNGDPLGTDERAEMLRYAASVFRFMTTGETASGELREV